MQKFLTGISCQNIEDNKLYVFFKKKHERKLSPNNYVNSALINLSLGEKNFLINF